MSINGNNEQIREMAMILLYNAIKYSDASGSIDISLKRRNNDAALSVTNTGTGIPEEHLAKIFDRFYRTDKSRARNQDGYGLGLAIANLVCTHGQNSGTLQYYKSFKTVYNSSRFMLIIYRSYRKLGGRP